VTDDARSLGDRLAQVRQAISDAAQRTGRDAAQVRIVAVTKTFPPDVATAALAAGLTDLGENYVQEARAKRPHVAGGTWHLIGGLQRNKVRAAVATFDLIHTVDSPELATALADCAASTGRRLRVLVQVNVGGEATKRGAHPAAARSLCEAVVGMTALALGGLMTIGAVADDPEAIRPCFRALRELRDDLAHRLGVELPQLSMGMSDDFTVAVEEGATLVRLGRVLFGARGRGAWREG